MRIKESLYATGLCAVLALSPFLGGCGKTIKRPSVGSGSAGNQIAQTIEEDAYQKVNSLKRVNGNLEIEAFDLSGIQNVRLRYENGEEIILTGTGEGNNLRVDEVIKDKYPNQEVIFTVTDKRGNEYSEYLEQGNSESVPK